MKITFVTRSMWAGGAERVISELVKYYAHCEDTCSIITLDEQSVLYDIPSSVKFVAIGEIFKKNRLIDKILRYINLRKIIKETTPDIVVSLPEDIGIFVIPALFGLNVPVIVSERNNPWVMPWKRTTRILRKLVYPYVDGIIFQTKEASSFFPKHIRNKGIILPNPVDLNRFSNTDVLKRSKTVVSAGRLVEQKNFKLLIESFSWFHKIHPEYKLIIYGEGEMREELESLASNILSERAFEFPGRRVDLIDEMRKASIFVLSSDYEGLPNVVIEAMLLGLPVISTNCPTGGPKELINDGVNGLLVSVGDVSEMCKAMEKIASSEDYAMKLGDNAMKISRIYDSKVVANQWKEYFYEVIQTKQKNTN